jgi:hypothetical protein
MRLDLMVRARDERASAALKEAVCLPFILKRGLLPGKGAEPHERPDTSVPERSRFKQLEQGNTANWVKCIALPIPARSWPVWAGPNRERFQR